MHRLHGQSGFQQLVGAFDRRTYRFQSTFHDAADIAPVFRQLDRAPRDAVDVEKVVDDFDKLRALPINHLQHFCPHEIVRLGGLQEFDRVADGRQRIAQLVHQDCNEIVDAPGRHRQRLDFAPLRQVLRDRGVAQQRPAVVMQCRDHHVGPEPRPILFYPPTFVLEAAVLLGAIQCMGRPVADEVGRRIKDAAMPADDFGGVVLLDAFRAGVPAQDVPAGIEQDDRVVLHAVGHQLEHPRIDA